MLPEASLYSPCKSGCQKHSSANCLHRSTACQKHTSVANSAEMEILGPVIDGERCWEMLRVSLCFANLCFLCQCLSCSKCTEAWKAALPQACLSRSRRKAPLLRRRKSPTRHQQRRAYPRLIKQMMFTRFQEDSPGRICIRSVGLLQCLNWKGMGRLYMDWFM